jgi:hypothetical protein
MKPMARSPALRLEVFANHALRADVTNLAPDLQDLRKPALRAYASALRIRLDRLWDNDCGRRPIYIIDDPERTAAILEDRHRSLPPAEYAGWLYDLFRRMSELILDKNDLIFDMAVLQKLDLGLFGLRSLIETELRRQTNLRRPRNGGRNA